MYDFGYDGATITPLHNIEKIDEDVYYITTDGCNIVITVTNEPTEFMHIIIDLCSMYKDVKTHLLRNSMFKRCVCGLCNIIYTNYVIEHSCNSTLYVLQLCINCVEKISANISHNSNNYIVTIDNMMNIYSIGDVKYVVINKLNQMIVNNKRTITTELCKVCKFTLTMHDICKSCNRVISTGFIRYGSKKCSLMYYIMLPELANIIRQLFIAINIVEFS